MTAKNKYILIDHSYSNSKDCCYRELDISTGEITSVDAKSLPKTKMKRGDVHVNVVAENGEYFSEKDLIGNKISFAFLRDKESKYFFYDGKLYNLNSHNVNLKCENGVFTIKFKICIDGNIVTEFSHSKPFWRGIIQADSMMLDFIYPLVFAAELFKKKYV